MSNKAKLAQNAVLYFSNKLGPTSYELLTLDNLIKGPDRGGAEKQKLEVTDLSSTRQEFVTGLQGEELAEFECNQSNTAVQIALEAARDSGDTVNFCFAYGDGTTVPTISATTGVITAPTNLQRSSYSFSGQVSKYMVGGATPNAILKANISVILSGTTATITKVQA